MSYTLLYVTTCTNVNMVYIWSGVRQSLKSLSDQPRIMRCKCLECNAGALQSLFSTDDVQTCLDLHYSSASIPVCTVNLFSYGCIFSWSTLHTSTSTPEGNIAHNVQFHVSVRTPITRQHRSWVTKTNALCALRDAPIHCRECWQTVRTCS